MVHLKGLIKDLSSINRLYVPVCKKKESVDVIDNLRHLCLPSTLIGYNDKTRINFIKSCVMEYFIRYLYFLKIKMILTDI